MPALHRRGADAHVAVTRSVESVDQLYARQDADPESKRARGVTEAARKLQTSGLINYSRGHITVLDRPGLEHRTCECYGVVKKEYERLLPVRTAQ